MTTLLESSSHGAANSIPGTLSQPSSLYLTSSMAESERQYSLRMAEYAREIKESCARILELLQEEINATELVNEAFPISGESLPSKEATEEQSIVDESFAVRNLTGEEVMPMSEILAKPLVRMPLLHHDVNYPLADLTYCAVANPPSLQEPRSFTKRTPLLSHKMAPNQLLSVPPWKELQWMHLTLKFLSHARRNATMKSLPPKPPYWTYCTMSKPPQPPEPPDMSSYVVIISLPMIAKVLKFGACFITFGGNYVWIADMLAILHDIEKSNIQNNSLSVGSCLMECIKSSQEKHKIIWGLSLDLVLIIGYDFNCVNGSKKFVLAATHRSVIHAYKLSVKFPKGDVVIWSCLIQSCDSFCSANFASFRIVVMVHLGLMIGTSTLSVFCLPNFHFGNHHICYEVELVSSTTFSHFKGSLQILKVSQVTNMRHQATQLCGIIIQLIEKLQATLNAYVLLHNSILISIITIYLGLDHIEFGFYYVLPQAFMASHHIHIDMTRGKDNGISNVRTNKDAHHNVITHVPSTQDFHFAKPIFLTKLYQILINALTYGESGFGYWDNKLDGECVGVLQTFYHKAIDALGREFLVNQRLTKAVTVQFVWMRLVELQQVTILNIESKYAKLQEGMGSYILSIFQASRVNICSSTPSTHMFYSFSQELSKGTFSYYSIQYDFDGYSVEGHLKRSKYQTSSQWCLLKMNASSLAVWIDVSYMPKSNLEEVIHFFIIHIKKFSLGKRKWDPSFMNHSTFTLSECCQTFVLAKQIEDIFLVLCIFLDYWNFLALSLRSWTNRCFEVSKGVFRQNATGTNYILEERYKLGFIIEYPFHGAACFLSVLVQELQKFGDACLFHEKQFIQWDPGGSFIVHVEVATIILHHYLDFNLEDKVDFNGGSNVMIQNNI